MHGIGLGQSDFRALRIRKNYYIDKTMYIKDIIDNNSSVILVTRPRRFGKTLNMSMLRYYFDCSQKDNKELFEGLKIMEQGEEYTSKLGYYPCIYLTLKDISEVNYQNMILNLKTAVSDMYLEHIYLLDSDKIYPFEKEKINNILDKERLTLVSLLNTKEGRKDEKIKFNNIIINIINNILTDNKIKCTR